MFINFISGLIGGDVVGMTQKIVDYFTKPETQAHLVNVVVIILAMFVLNFVLKRLTKRVTKRIDKWDEDESAREKRAKTLVRVLKHTITIIILVIGVLMILREVGINITPLLTGAGIVGVAVGFGAQSIVKDFFSGFFILLENQFREGDVVKLGDVSGSVEEINLRITKLRDIHGTLHFVPNGEIRKVSNMSFLWSQAVISVGVAYDSDIKKVFDVLNQIIEWMENDPDTKNSILEKPSVSGVEELGDSSIGFRMLIKTKPKEQWAVARTARIKIKEEFEKAGIEIPYPHIVVKNN